MRLHLFEGRQTHSLEEIREALQLTEHVPLITCDARSRQSVARALTATVVHTMHTASGAAAAVQ